MTPNFGSRPLTEDERKNLAGHLSQQLASTMRKSDTLEIAKRHPEMSLLGIEQNILDLVAFRQDALERLAALEALNDPEASDEIGEVRAELEAANMELAKMAGAEVAKVDNCANLIRMCDRMQAHCKDERDRMARKVKRWEAIKDAVENVVMEALVIAGRTSFDSPTNRLRVQRNGTPRVEITHPSMVQDRFIRVLVQFPLDLWKAIKTSCPELTGDKPLAYSPLEVKDQNFATGEIAKVMKQAAKEETAAKETMEGPQLADTLKQIERVKGAQLVYGKHLRCE
jgi:hypothetical protein